MKALRLLGMGWVFQLRMQWRDPFTGIFAVLYPMFFATVAFLMFRTSSAPQALLYASLGAGVMGIWSATSTTAGSAMQRRVLARDARGARRVAVALRARPAPGDHRHGDDRPLLHGRHARLGAPFLRHRPHDRQLARLRPGRAGDGRLDRLRRLPAAVSFVRYRTAWALGNLLEYPVWLVCGFLVPIALLPDWVRPISWLLAPTWGMSAIRESALGVTPWPDAVMCLALGGAYVALGVVVLERALGRPVHAPRCRSRDLVGPHLLHRRADELQGALRLDVAVDLHPDARGRGAVSDPALRLHRPNDRDRI
ncbi:MAG: ABC transporter permease [Gaiellaceae bacterium]